MKIVILDGHAENPGDLSWDGLNKFGEVTVYDRTPKDKITERAAEADIIVTNKTPIMRETLDALPKLKFITLLATGYNVVDVEYAAQKGIPVSNVPAYSTDGVAQLVFAFILERCSCVMLHDTAVKNGEWNENVDFSFWKAPLTEMSGKTIGIIGYGKTGSRVSEIAKAFGMRVLVNTANPEKYADSGETFLSLDEMLPQCDFLTLHTPLTDTTRGMVNAQFIAKMKKGAFLVNTSRGAVIDEQALADALNSGYLSGAGCDVLSSEPPKADNPLLTAKNSFITPHIAWACVETRKRLMDIFIGNVEAFISGHPRNVVNMQ